MALKIVNYNTAPRLSTVDIYGNTNLIIANLATLKNTDPSYNGQIITLLSHTVAGVGGGNFRADFTDTTTPDDDGLTIVTSGGKRWKRILQGFIDSDMFNGNAKKVIENANTKYAIKLLSDLSVSSTINIRSNTTIDCDGFALEPTGSIGVLDASGALSGSWTPLLADMLEYTSTFSTTLSLNVGDWVFIRSEALYSDIIDDVDPNDPPPVSKYGQIFKITNKNGNIYRTDYVSHHNFSLTDTAQISKINVVENCDIRKPKINKDTSTNQFLIGFRNLYVVNSIIQEPIIIGNKPKYGGDTLGKTALKFTHCVNVLVTNPKFYHIAAYGVEYSGACRNVNIENIYGHDCRHVVSFNWIDGYGKAIDCHVTGGTADTSTLSGFDTHPNSTKNCTFNKLLSVDSVRDSGFQIRSSSIIINYSEGNGNALDGIVGRGIGVPTQVNNFTARKNLRDGISFTDYGANLNNPITEDNVKSGIYLSSGIVSGGRSERNLFAFRVYNNVNDPNKIILNNLYAPFSVGNQTTGVFFATGYDAQKLKMNSCDFSGYGDFVFSVPSGLASSFVCQTDGNNVIHNSSPGNLLYGVAIFSGAGTQIINTTAFRNFITSTTTRGLLVSNVRLRILSGASGVTASFRPVTDKVSFAIDATGACTVEWRILGV